MKFKIILIAPHDHSLPCLPAIICFLPHKPLWLSYSPFVPLAQWFSTSTPAFFFFNPQILYNIHFMIFKLQFSGYIL